MKRLYIKPEILLELLENQNILMASNDNFDTDIWDDFEDPESDNYEENPWDDFGTGTQGGVTYTEESAQSTHDVWGKDTQ